MRCSSHLWLCYAFGSVLSLEGVTVWKTECRALPLHFTSLPERLSGLQRMLPLSHVTVTKYRIWVTNRPDLQTDGPGFKFRFGDWLFWLRVTFFFLSTPTLVSLHQSVYHDVLPNAFDSSFTIILQFDLDSWKASLNNQRINATL